MLATRKHVTCQTLVQVQTCARPSISYAHTSHLDTRTRAPRGKYLSYAAHHNTKARKQAHRTVSTITCKHMCSAPHFSTLRWWRYDESHAIPKASETLDLRTAQTNTHYATAKVTKHTSCCWLIPLTRPTKSHMGKPMPTQPAPGQSRSTAHSKTAKRVGRVRNFVRSKWCEQRLHTNSLSSNTCVFAARASRVA